MSAVLRRVDRHRDPAVVTLAVTAGDGDDAPIVFEMSLDTARWPVEWSFVQMMRRVMPLLAKRTLRTIAMGHVLVGVPKVRGGQLRAQECAVDLVEYVDQVAPLDGSELLLTPQELSADLGTGPTWVGRALEVAMPELRRRGIDVERLRGARNRVRYQVRRNHVRAIERPQPRLTPGIR